MIIQGDARSVLFDLDPDTVQTCITSPPYFNLRDYQAGPNEIGGEKQLDDYIDALVDTFRAVKHVLKPDGTLFLNLGDTYKSGHMLGVPWRVALALIGDGWVLRNEIIWAKPNPMPESCKNRFTKAHEHIFFFALKSSGYKFNQQKETATYAGTMRGGSKNRYEQNSAGMDAKQYDTRNLRDVWTVRPASLSGAHFAIFPDELITPCVLAGASVGDICLDPFAGSGTVGVVARQKGRDFIGVELSPEFAALARERVAGLWSRKWPTDLQTWHQVYGLIAETLETDCDDEIRAFHEVLTDELNARRAEVFAFNDALDNLIGNFTTSGARYLRKVRAAQDPDGVAGFDEVVAMAAGDPYYAPLIQGPGDPEANLFETLRNGRRPIPRITDDDIWQSLLTR